MKNLIVALSLLITVATQAQQEQKPIPQINVTGEGKVMVAPDEAFITLSIETKGNKAADVKKQNDAIVEKVVKVLRNSKLSKDDYQTQRIALNPTYDYEKKKYNYNAIQTIQITLRDLSYYDALIENLIDAGVNRITNVDFRSSKIEQHRSTARKNAMLDAKQKADDYVSVLSQKVGGALMISDNTQVHYPQPVYAMARMTENADAAAPRETLAIGQITVTANVNVSFFLN
ncbi:MAG: SIMPL domain-containing protein [Flavobacterium sp.]|nr:SIMPL domain-containing protein [Flavobacterium sp.]